MADANGLQRAIRPTGVFNIKKMAADFCSAQCIMDNTGFHFRLKIHLYFAHADDARRANSHGYKRIIKRIPFWTKVSPKETKTKTLRDHVT